VYGSEKSSENIPAASASTRSKEKNIFWQEGSPERFY
jgi:hypothetical protein